MDEEFWRLPGPARFIADAVREIGRGRHVAAILPRYLADVPGAGDRTARALSAALTAAGEDPVIAMADPDEPPLTWLAQALVFRDDPPGTTGDLLDDPYAARRTAVLDATQLNEAQCSDIADLLARLAAESRPRPAEKRPRVAIVGTHQCVPRLQSGDSDVTFQPLWWWGRLSRWDVAARLSTHVDCREPGVLRDVYLETLIEVCRWDLALADEVAPNWDGDPDTLADLIAAPGPAASWLPTRPTTDRPHPALTAAWNAAAVDLWHNEFSTSLRGAQTDRIERAVWAAQARVLMPWIETRRHATVSDLLRTFGRSAVLRAVGAPAASSMIEVGPLVHAVHALHGRTRLELCDAVRRLRDARNQLAHLRTLTGREQRDLVAAFAGA
jgi:hypothetical protein